MSFITRRERVFNEYDLFDLPARNEGKLKAYASCTDARAWSHFCSDKSEHLVDVIKRNNETVRPKYLPTDVIVDTLMITKNAEIERLKRKIEEFEQMLTAYDQLDLSCEQKCEIAQAHAAIRAANKDLDDLFIDLDLSGYTEGVDSEGFATGKSRGDEEPCSKMFSKGVQNDNPCTCEVATLVKDPRITEMQDIIITKDAKLCAMKNTIAVMENDLCEPYCIYAHIYTALEKIFGILCQNDKYRQYLKLLTAGKDIRCIDIKGKILFKLKVLEKFSCALMAPCTQDFISYPNQQSEDCACYRVNVSQSRVQTTYALTSVESKQPSLDNKRAQLVADIIQNDEMKELIFKDNASFIPEEDRKDEVLIVDNPYNIDQENLKRLKSLQENYDELITCYENLKQEKDSFEKRCYQYEEMEKEYESMKVQMHEYNSLWNEKEHFRRRSVDLDSLREQYLILTDETSNLETELKAEGEINQIRSKALDGLRSENISLEKRINEASIDFEKDKNALLIKLKEADCRTMCQEQQIKSLLQQIDKLLDHEHEKAHVLTYSREPETNSLALLDEIESSKEQIQNLKDALLCNEEEKQDIQKRYQHHLELINDLKLEIEDWKSTYEKTLQRNDYLEKYNESLKEEVKNLNQDMDEKSNAVENLINVIKNKSQEINKLMQDIEKERDQNRNLYKQLNELRDRFENEKLETLQSLQIARQESQELLDKIKDYDEVVHKKADVTKSLEQQLQDNKELKDFVMATIDENRKLKEDLESHESHNSILLQEIQRLHNINEYAVESINSLEDQNKRYKTSFDLTRKESGELKDKIRNYENLTLKLQESHNTLLEEKTRFENELIERSCELENTIHSIQLSKRESEEIIDRLQQSEGSKDSELSRIREAHQKLYNEKYAIQQALIEKKRDIDNLVQTLNNLKEENEKLVQKCSQADDLEQELEDLKKDFAKLSNERNILETDKTEQLNHLYNTLETKIEENRELMEHIKSLETKQSTATNAIQTLQGEKMMTQSRLNVIKKESAELVDKIKHYELIETEYEKSRRALERMTCEKQNLQTELNRQLADLRRMERENSELHSHSQNLLSHSEDLECALIDARKELIEKSSDTSEPFKNIMDEIEVMRQEKHQNQLKIRDLHNQLDKSENIISGLSDDVLARDGKIANLQNHINELEEEVSRLHSSLDVVISTGEQMKDFSLQKIDTLQNIEAHHSRATHNMKMELAKLQNENFILSEQLSETKIKSDESLQNKYQYASQVKLIINEREIIVTNIKQLELESVGDTALTPNNCTVEDILASLDRIRESFKTKTTKSFSLERTLLKVQTSSQLLLSKADEAKKIVEREKQKIISEKEDAIIDKQNMETELFDLKAKLEKQIANDKGIIDDLEATILNQKLIIDRITKSTQDYISKLKEELQTLKDLYENSVERIGELEEKLRSMTEDKSNQSVMMEEIKANLGKKSKEVAELQKQLEVFKKPRNVEAQAKIMDIYRNMGSQTDKENFLVKIDKIQTTQSSATMIEEKNVGSTNMEEVNKLPLALDKSYTQHERKSKNLFLGNEVQVLSATVEQPFEITRSKYVDYKMKQLSTGRLEQYSINGATVKEKNENVATATSPSKKPRGSGKKSANPKSNNLIDIYNRQDLESQHTTTSSKGIDESENITTGKIASQSPGKSTEYAATRESFETDSNIISKYRDIKTYEGSSSSKLTDKDLFIIYKDSDSSSNNNKELSKGTWSDKGHPDIVIEAVTVHPTKKGISTNIISPTSYIKLDTLIFQENEHNSEKAIPKHKLRINLPRVITETASVDTTSDVDKKSFDSYSLALYSSPNQFSDSDTKFNEGFDGKIIKVSLPTISDEDKQYLESYNALRVGSDEDAARPRIIKTNEEAFEMENVTSKQKHSIIPRKKATISTPFDNESHHKLSRVGADVLLLKTEQDQKVPQIGMRQNFGLEYIMDTVQGEVDPDVEKYYTTKELRKTRSDDVFNLRKIRERADSTPSKLSEYKMSSTVYKTISSNSKYSEKSPEKSYTERSIMTKLDVNNDYEIQINTLTKALENIEKDYKKKIEAIKMQYDNNIKSIINEHNQGVKSIQSLHEETLQDLNKLHESEVENLRAMSMEAMRKADKLEKENRALKTKAQDSRTICLDEEPIKMTSPEIKKRRKCRGDTRMLTTTTVEAINVRPKKRLSGPCTCSLDVNISDTIRNIFEQVDVEQRKMAEHSYLKYIANKILHGNGEGSGTHDALLALDTQELSFLHLKVCRSWKMKLNKEEALQKRIDSLENELMSKQRNAQQHITELDRKVVEERQRLQEVLEAVCSRTTASSRAPSPNLGERFTPSPASNANAERDACGCIALNMGENSRPLTAELDPKLSSLGFRATVRRPRPESNRATLARQDGEERRERKPTYNDEPPTRLRRSYDRHPPRFANKK